MYIIPSIYIKDDRTLQIATGGRLFDLDPVNMAKELFSIGAEFLHLIDLNVPASGTPQHLPIIERIIKETGLKVQIAGNIRSTEVVEKYLGIGAERVALGILAYQKPDFLKAVCKDSPKKIAAHIEVRGGKVVITGWTVAAKKTALDYATQFKEAGVSVILYSDVQEEGKITPDDIKRVKEFSRKSPLPIIHTTDVSTSGELELVLSLESSRILGTVFGRSMYSGAIDITSTITHAKERTPAGMDEPTLLEE